MCVSWYGSCSLDIAPPNCGRNGGCPRIGFAARKPSLCLNQNDRAVIFILLRLRTKKNTEFYAKALPVAFHLVLCLDGTNHTVHIT